MKRGEIRVRGWGEIRDKVEKLEKDLGGEKYGYGWEEYGFR